jgi:hypothetical protein
MMHENDAVYIISAPHDGHDWGKIRITEEIKRPS